MRVGSINVGDIEVGVVNWSVGAPDDSMMGIRESLSGHPLGFEPTAKSPAPVAKSHRSHENSQHKETPEEHKHNSIRYGHHVRREDTPHTSSGNPFDRTRFDKELKEKPWLKEKIAHIALGEHQSKEGIMGVTESMMNRAVVRDTSLEAQAKRHRTSGVDEHGYYAGYKKNISAEERTLFDKSLDEVLGHTGKGQSNITNYATENASGDLAAREARSGAFVHRKEIEGEHFFAPGKAEPVFRDRWSKLHDQAVAFEKGQGNTNAEGAKTEPLGPGIVTHHGTGRTPEPHVVRSMAYASAMAGVRTNIAHGDEGGHARHHHGASAGDIDLHDPTTGRKLDARYSEDRKKMESYIEHAAASGSTGIGFGQGGSYMGHSRMHVGGGTPAVWGAGGHGVNAPSWVRSAYERGRANPVSPAQQHEVIAKAKAAEEQRVREASTPYKEASKPPEKEPEKLVPITVDESDK